MAVKILNQFEVNGEKLERWGWNGNDDGGHYRWSCFKTEHYIGSWLISQKIFVISMSPPGWISKTQLAELIKFIEVYERLQ